MHALVVLDTVRNCVMLEIVDGLGGEGGRGKARGLVTCPQMIVRILHTSPEPDRKCVLYFKGEICNARWHGTST